MVRVRVTAMAKVKVKVKVKVEAMTKEGEENAGNRSQKFGFS